VTVSDAYNNPPAWQPSNATDGQTVLGAAVEVAPPPGNGWHAMIARSPDTLKWVQVDLGSELPLDEVRLYPARPKDFPARRGFGFPVRFRVEAAADASFTKPLTLFDRTPEDFENPAENPVVIPANGLRARFVRVTATRLWARSNDYIFALAELEVWAGGSNVARSGEVTSLDSIESPSWARRFLIDGFNSQGRIVALPEWLRGLSRRREVELELGRVAFGRAALGGSMGAWRCAGAGVSPCSSRRPWRYGCGTALARGGRKSSNSGSALQAICTTRSAAISGASRCSARWRSGSQGRPRRSHGNPSRRA